MQSLNIPFFLKKNNLFPFVAVVVAGQLLFALYSPFYTQDRYSAELFATIGIRYDGTDLHKLNEGAHYFGQTIIGWTRFPGFNQQISAFANLPKGATFSAHMQERQNVIFRVEADSPITQTMIEQVRAFVDQRLTAYGQQANVVIQLANVDYQLHDNTRSYPGGAGLTLLISMILMAFYTGWHRLY